MFQPSFNLTTLAPYEQVDAFVLRVEDFEEGVSKGALGACALARNGDGLVRTRSGLVFDQVFEVVIVDVDWVAA